MDEQTPEAQFAGEVAKQLIAMRRRGLHRIEQRPRIEAPETELLARDYSLASGLILHGRIAQITRLLQDGLVAYGEQGKDYDRRLIDRLLFDSLITASTTGPTDVLKKMLEESGKDESDFRTERHERFENFASFLVAFVTDAVHEAVQDHEPEDIPEPPPPLPPDRNRLPLVWIGATIAAVVLIGGILTVVVLAGRNNNVGQAGRPASSPSSSPHPSPPPYVADKTYTEQEGSFGAPTFTDPHNPSVSGPKVPAFQKVEVACKVLSPTIPSASPDGYWYRLAGGLWNGDYAVANTFFNGDSIGGPYTHNTDFNVPDCPS